MNFKILTFSVIKMVLEKNKNISLPATAVLLRPPLDSGGPVAKFLVTD
jgi:hypothetical protein